MSDEHGSVNNRPCTDDSPANTLRETSFSVSFYEGAEEDSAYRTSNDPSQPYEREMVFWRNGLNCESRIISHGRLSPEAEDHATLLVYDFNFNPKPGSRITSFSATFKFSGHEHSSDPLVSDFAPRGRHTFQPMSQEESHKKSGEAQVGVSQFGGDLSYTWKRETAVTHSTTQFATLQGSYVCDRFGHKVGVTWSIEENQALKQSIPTFLRTALLLKREDNSEFKGTVDIVVDTGWKSDVRRFFGVKETDEPILYDPSKASAQNLNIASVNKNDLLKGSTLAELVDVVFHTEVQGAERRMVL